MYKIIYLTVVFFMFTIELMSQNIHKISYGVEYLGYSIDTTNVESAVLQYLLKDENTSKQFLNNKDILFELYFNRNQSIFISIDLLEKDDDSKSISGKSKISEYAYSLKKNQLYEKNYSKFIQIKTPAYDWKILDEYKYILGYKCQKAIINDYSKSKPKIVAWFTEEIPLPYGPVNFYGLPGIILELDRSDRRVYAQKIEETNFSDMNEFLDEKKFSFNEKE